MQVVPQCPLKVQRTSVCSAFRQTTQKLNQNEKKNTTCASLLKNLCWIATAKFESIFLLLTRRTKAITLTLAKLVICDVKGLNPIMGYVQEDVVSQKYRLIATGVGVANGCLEELQGFIVSSVSLPSCKNTINFSSVCVQQLITAHRESAKLLGIFDSHFQQLKCNTSGMQ